MILVSCIRPFDAKQKIYVLTSNREETEEMRLTSLDKFSETVMDLISEYGVNDIVLYGNPTICANERDKILAAELAKYNNNQLKISLKGAI